MFVLPFFSKYVDPYRSYRTVTRSQTAALATARGSPPTSPRRETLPSRSSDATTSHHTSQRSPLEEIWKRAWNIAAGRSKQSASRTRLGIVARKPLAFTE